MYLKSYETVRAEYGFYPFFIIFWLIIIKKFGSMPLKYTLGCFVQVLNQKRFPKTLFVFWSVQIRQDVDCEYITRSGKNSVSQQSISLSVATDSLGVLLGGLLGFFLLDKLWVQFLFVSSRQVFVFSSWLTNLVKISYM